MPASPRVSVIVPNYNYARYLPGRLQSVFEQTFQDFEVLLLDDASSDDSESVLAQYEADSRVRIFRNETNSGNVFKQWNAGVRAAAGEYIWLAEADDLADPRLLEVLVSRLDSDPNIGLAYCGSHVIDENGTVVDRAENRLDHLDTTRWQSDFHNDGRDECARFLVMRNTIFNASAVVFRRAVYEEIGMADENLKLSGDWMTWAKMLLRSDIAYVAEPLNYFRRHPQTVRSQVDRSARKVLESYRVVAQILQSLEQQHIEVKRAMRERVFNGLVEDWAVAVLPQNHASQRRYNRAIYRVARTVDPQINKRLATRLLAFAGERLSTRAARLPFWKSRGDVPAT